MKAAIYLGKEHIEVRELPNPVCGDNDVIIQNIYSSICGTDVAVYTKGPNTGHKVTVGGEFGHETVSRVVEVGKNVTEFQVGERVYPYPLYAKNDTRRAGTIGGFSEYILVPEAKRGQPQKEESAVVFGCGTIGLAAAVALKYFGMDKVLLCDMSDFRLKIAENLGFAICNTGKENFVEKAADYFGTAPALTGMVPNIDCWIDAAGAEGVLDSFMQNGKIISRFVVVAVNNKPRQIRTEPLM